MTNERERHRQNVRRRPGNAPTTENASKDTSAKTATSSQAGSSDAGGAGKGQRTSGSVRIFGAIAIAVAVATIGALSFMGGGGDTITDSESQSRLAAYQTFAASPGLPVKLVGADEVDDALMSMPDTVPTEVRDEMRQQINQGSLQLAWVTLWDTHAEDGDILRFESSTSIPIEVMALNAKTTFAIPYPADGQVLVTGVKDGGGGITIALESGATSIAWPTMAPGDQLLLPLTPTF